MNRSDLVEELAAHFDQLTQRDAEFAVKAILDAMNDALVRGHRIEIRGFGSFSINRRSPRIGRNPRSGLEMIAAVRHQRTAYDELLLGGLDRALAREQVRDQVEETLEAWRGPAA